MAAPADGHHSDKSNMGIFPSYLAFGGKSLSPEEISKMFTFSGAPTNNLTWEEIQAAKPDLVTPRMEPDDNKKSYPHNWFPLQPVSLDQIKDTLPHLIESMGTTFEFNSKTFGYDCLTPPKDKCRNCVDVKRYNCKYCIGTKWHINLYEKKDGSSQFTIEFVKGRGCGFHSMQIQREFTMSLLKLGWITKKEP